MLFAHFLHSFIPTFYAVSLTIDPLDRLWYGVLLCSKGPLDLHFCFRHNSSSAREIGRSVVIFLRDNDYRITQLTKSSEEWRFSL